MKNLILILMLVATNVHAWGTPATATTTITANITGWTEDPCDFPEHQDKCDLPPPSLFQPERISTDSANISYSISAPVPVPYTPYVQQNTNYE